MAHSWLTFFYDKSTRFSDFYVHAIFVGDVK